MALTRDEALCLRIWDWSETSQTAQLLTRSHGLVRCLAKGAKRPDNKFSGGLEVLTRIDILVSLRNIERSGDGLSTLAAADLIEVFPRVRRSIDAFYAGLALADVLSHAMIDGDPHETIYDHALDALRCLCIDAPESSVAAMVRLLWAVLLETGHAPDLATNIVTGSQLSDGASLVFLPRRGGFVDATNFADGLPSRDEGPRWRVRATTLDALRHIARESDTGKGAITRSNTTESAYPVGTDSVTRVCKLLAANFREVFSCDPKALRSWEDRLRSHEVPR